MKTFPRVAWAAALVSAGGCTTLLGLDNEYHLVANTTTQGGGGDGSSTAAVTSTTTGQGGGASSTTSSASGSTGTGTTPCDPLYTCAEAIVDGDPTLLCSGPSAALYNAFYACTCVIGGPCFATCSDEYCTIGVKSAECIVCLQTNSSMGCAKEFEACTNDVPCDPLYTCAEAIEGDPTKLCDGAHGDLYDAYYDCTCVSGGACFMECSNNLCTQGWIAKSVECVACLQMTTMGCAYKFEACSGDLP